MQLTEAYQSAFSIGEIADKLSICLIKRSNHPSLTENELDGLNHIIEGLFNILYHSILTNHPQRLISLLQGLSKLIEINSRQWEAEDRLREEMTPEAAIAARRINSERVAAKNEIDKVFGLVGDIKLYKGEG